MKKLIIPILLIALTLLFGCGKETEITPKFSGITDAYPFEEDNIYSEDDVVWDNSKIDTEDIEVAVVREKIPTFYDYIKLEITNNSQYFLCWNGIYNIYEKTEAGYVLIDGDGDGVTSPKNQLTEVIESGKTVIKVLRLDGIITENSAKIGEYKIEIPLAEDKFLTAEFEVTEEDLPFDSEIEIVFPADEFAIDSEEYFSYTLINNSENDLGVSLSLIISKYEDGEWVRLPIIQQYDGINYPSAIPQLLLPAGGKAEQEFWLSLADIVDAELTPGKYRMEKEIFHDWYFVEFVLY